MKSLFFAYLEGFIWIYKFYRNRILICLAIV